VYAQLAALLIVVRFATVTASAFRRREVYHSDGAYP
jgi:hypothetical protein